MSQECHKNKMQVGIQFIPKGNLSICVNILWHCGQIHFGFIFLFVFLSKSPTTLHKGLLVSVIMWQIHIYMSKERLIKIKNKSCFTCYAKHEQIMGSEIGLRESLEQREQALITRTRALWHTWSAPTWAGQKFRTTNVPKTSFFPEVLFEELLFFFTLQMLRKTRAGQGWIPEPGSLPHVGGWQGPTHSWALGPLSLPRAHSSRKLL